MKVKPSLFKERRCYALIWETDCDFEISLLQDDNKQLLQVLDGMANQIAVEDPAKLARTVRYGVYVGIYFQSLFKADQEQPHSLSDLAPELDPRPLIFKDVYRNIDLIGVMQDGSL